MLYRLGEDGTMALEKPNPERYKLISSFKIPSAGKGLALTHPVVCGGRLYIRHQHILYCYDISSTKKCKIKAFNLLVGKKTLS